VTCNTSCVCIDFSNKKAYLQYEICYFDAWLAWVREIVNLQFVQAMVSNNKNLNMKQENAQPSELWLYVYTVELVSHLKGEEMCPFNEVQSPRYRGVPDERFYCISLYSLHNDTMFITS